MKTICIYHSIDLDGWMSAAIVKHWYEKKHYGNTLHHGNVIVDPNEDLHSLTFIGYNYGQSIPNLSEYDKVIMCDISFPMKSQYDEMWKLYINSKVSKEIIWIDHHISAINDYNECIKFNPNLELEGLRDTKFAACELTWKYFFPNEPMPEIVRLLGRYDCFGHKGTDEEVKVLEFQYGARQCISNYEKAYGYLMYSIKPVKYNKQIINGFNTYETIEDKLLQSGKYIYQYLCTEANQTYSKAFSITFNEEIIIQHETCQEPSLEIRDFLCVNQERFNPINFGIDYHKDGYDGFACFWYKDGKWNWSLYNDNGEVDCSVIAKQYGGGGHKGASGFICGNETMLSIINKD